MGIPNIIYSGCRMHCTSSFEPNSLANHLPLWLILELASFSQQSLMACLVETVARSILRSLGINMFREFSFSESELHPYPPSPTTDYL